VTPRRAGHAIGPLSKRALAVVVALLRRSETGPAAERAGSGTAASGVGFHGGFQARQVPAPARAGLIADHRPQLDALRCIAVLAVLITHFWQPRLLPGILRPGELGLLGVQLFFVLSGFLITGILLDCRYAAERSHHRRVSFVGRFYARRFLRIFPVYYLIVLVAVIIDLPPARELWRWLVTYTSNFYVAIYQESVGRFGHFWSLAVEEQFYLVWPWLVLFAPRRWLAGLVVVVIGLAPLYRDFVFRAFGADDWARMTLPFASLDSLGAGALLALVTRESPAPDALYTALRRVILPVGLGAYVALHWIAARTGYPRLLIAFHETAYALVCCWLVAFAARGFHGFTGRVLESRPMVYLGKISYGIYAYHLFLPWLLDRGFRRLGLELPGHGPARFAIAGLATLLVAVASWHLMERPLSDLKRYFPYRARSPRFASTSGQAGLTSSGS
jgi:peptidoglycan/LPS O-acetylase OafA/YrhL